MHFFTSYAQRAIFDLLIYFPCLCSVFKTLKILPKECESKMLVMYKNTKMKNPTIWILYVLFYVTRIKGYLWFSNIFSLSLFVFKTLKISLKECESKMLVMYKTNKIKSQLCRFRSFAEYTQITVFDFLKLFTHLFCSGFYFTVHN